MIEPRLRFKTDDGSDFPDWEEKILGDVAECLDNKRVPVNAEDRKKRVGTVPYYGAGGIQGYIDEYLFDEELVLLLEDGDAFDDFQVKSIAQYITGKSWVNNHAHVLRAKDNAYFLFASLEHKDIRRWTQLAGASRKKLLKESMLKITIMIPSLPEQQKIADFLSTIDTIIEKQQATVSAWEERKKGVMQKLFSQEVRFKADDGSDFPELEAKSLFDICEYKNKQSVGKNYVGTENMKQNFSGLESLDEETEMKGVCYCKGDTLMSNIRPYLRKTWKADREGVCSTDVLVFHPIDVVSEYLHYLIASDKFISYVMTGVKGVKMPRGDKEHMMKFSIMVPSLPEQQKIADCLSALDAVIEKQKETLEKWQELKKGLLQQMFV